MADLTLLRVIASTADARLRARPTCLSASQIEKAFTAGSYKPKIENYKISAKEMLEFERETKAEAQQLAQKRKEGFDALNRQCVPPLLSPAFSHRADPHHILSVDREAVYVAEYQAELEKAKEAEAAAAAAGSGGKSGSSASAFPHRLRSLASFRASLTDRISISPSRSDGHTAQVACPRHRALDRRQGGRHSVDRCRPIHSRGDEDLRLDQAQPRTRRQDRVGRRRRGWRRRAPRAAAPLCAVTAARILLLSLERILSRVHSSYWMQICVVRRKDLFKRAIRRGEACGGKRQRGRGGTTRERKTTETSE